MALLPLYNYIFNKNNGGKNRVEFKVIRIFTQCTVFQHLISQLSIRNEMTYFMTDMDVISSFAMI